MKKLRYTLNETICNVDNCIVNIDGYLLEFDGSISHFINKVNEGNILDEEDHKSLELLVNAGVLVEDNNYWVPLNYQYTFFGMPKVTVSNDIILNKHRIGVFGVPYYSGTTSTIGLDGIEVLRRVSPQVADVADIGIGNNDVVRDYGSIPLRYTNLESITKLAKSVFSSRIRPLFIGGDHTITYPLIQGCLLSNNEPLTLLYFDSHSDLGELNNRVAHNNVFTWINQDPRIQLVSYGNFNFFGEKELREVSDASFHFSSPNELVEYLSENTSNLYISFDFDCLSTAAVSYPNGYGKEMGEIVTLLEKIRDLHNINILGIDFVEYNSLYDTKNWFEARKACDIIARLLTLLKAK